MLQLTEDKLNRGPFLDSLFALFENFGNQGNRGLTMLLNGRYGSGKSTLLNFLQEQNSVQNKFDIVTYNAWENNYFADPMIPMLYEISKLKRSKSRMKECTKKILKSIPRVIVDTVANVHGVDLRSLMTNENIFDDYDKYKKALDEFRAVLTAYCKDKKVLFIIDELDRCLPEYQIKVLEILHFLFEIPNLIVIIALDREQLECAIENKFGNSQNITGYLSKFINYQVDLPNDSDFNFIRSLLRFDCLDARSYDITYLICQMLTLMKFSIRDSKMIVDEINLICNEKDSFGNDKRIHYWVPLLVAFILITKYANDSIYKKWFFTEKQSNYGTEVKELKKCTYFDFLEDIKNTNLELIINFLRHKDSFTEHIGQFFLLHLIESFSSTSEVSSQEFSEYLNLGLNYIETARSERFDYPSSINNVIKKVKVVKF